MKEVVILAGGFGTRLQHIVSDVPKPMAPINDTPFLTFLFKKLQHAGIEHIVLSTGYLHDKIEGYFGNKFENIKLTYSQETSPLGTGGALLFALSKTDSRDILILNGDTFFDINLEELEHFHNSKSSVLTVALREMEDVSRYGSVVINRRKRIIAFTEKTDGQSKNSGLINGGIYILERDWFLQLDLPEKFSFEKEVLEKLYTKHNFFGLNFNSYFIDIGLPEDYFRSQKELGRRFR